MRLAALFSGGKDSTYAIYYAVNQGWEIRYLITAIPKREYESFMWHYPTIKWTKVQADAMGIKQLQVEVSSRDEMKEIVEVLSELKKKEEIEGLISGVIASDYQKNRLDMLCEDLNLKLIAPLWQKDPLMLLNEIINSNFRVIVVSASAYGFTKEWLGKELNKRTVAELKDCLLYTSPSPRDLSTSRMPSSA